MAVYVQQGLIHKMDVDVAGSFSGVFALILWYLYQINLTLQSEGIRREQKQ
jgi:hypothetical protein